MEMHEIYLVSSVHISLPIPLNEVNREWAKGTDDERSGSGMGCESKEGWPCTGESFSEFNRQSRKVQHSPFFPALGTKPPGEEKCTGVKDRRGKEPGDERRVAET